MTPYTLHDVYSHENPVSPGTESMSGPTVTEQYGYLLLITKISIFHLARVIIFAQTSAISRPIIYFQWAILDPSHFICYNHPPM
jgi:hypothetical protein